ncbi:hypothetical protein, partial [Aestuariibaculum suncheonense]|uniref:hypothetical protein n=1 Tax=Aestuariibaculum suncheonense TaxID=1028745 RepID=UPI0019D5F820
REAWPSVAFAMRCKALKLEIQTLFVILNSFQDPVTFFSDENRRRRFMNSFNLIYRLVNKKVNPFV